ncbi:hypothetical protein ACVW16_004173 [Bradyrhizobium sp. USDA 4474]
MRRRQYKLNCRRKGLAVRMSDGWCGRIDFESRDTVVCIENGKAPNDWLDGYRAFSRELIASATKEKITVNWSSSRPTINRRAEVDAFLERARFRREWDSVPDVLH